MRDMNMQCGWYACPSFYIFYGICAVTTFIYGGWRWMGQSLTDLLSLNNNNPNEIMLNLIENEIPTNCGE